MSDLGDKKFQITVHRRYPDNFHYTIPNTFNDETEIFSYDADLLVGNYKEDVLYWGMMPYSGYFHYFLTEDTIIDAWNAKAKSLGYSKLKAIEFTNDQEFFKVVMQF